MMSSRRGSEKPLNAGAVANSSAWSKNAPQDVKPTTDQLTQGVANVCLDTTDGGEWEVYARKSKNRTESSAQRPWPQQSSNSKPWGWGQPNAISKVGMRNNNGSGKAYNNVPPAQTADAQTLASRGGARPQSYNRGLDTNYVSPPAVISAPLQGGWNWPSRPSAAQPRESEGGKGIAPNEVEKENIDDGDDSGSDAVDDSDDDVYTDDFESDDSEKSHDSQKKSKWFKAFFEILDKLTVDEISEPARQWHCPACQGGPGAIDWYRGLQPLVSHANTKGSQRVKIHRDFAKLLNEELQRRGTSVVPAGEAFGKWKGLETTAKDREIVWPPMVIIMNTKLDKDEKDKWVGMGNQELLDYFSPYAAVKARHSYGPQGHRGMSVLIFEASAVGYVEAERLHKHFVEQHMDRHAWDCNPVRFYPGGKRQLYGYMALKEDLDIFNQHSTGKSRLKFEMRSYQEMVVSQMKQMSEDNQQLIMFKEKVAKEQRRSKALEQSFGIVTEKLRKTLEENRIVRQRTKMHHEQNKEEMDSQEQFFKEQIQTIRDARDAKEDEFEMLQQEKREKVKQENSNPSTMEDQKRRTEEVAKFIKLQDNEMEDFVAERDELIKAHDEKIMAMRCRHLEEQLKLEKEIDGQITELMRKYTHTSNP